jgi:glutathione S-transferase
MLTLYYSPASVSLASHIALEESGLPYELEEVSLKTGQHLTPSYLAIHPLGRVPALRLENSQVLTEVAAIHFYLAERVPEQKLMPESGWQRVRATEWLSFFASSVHEAFISFYQPRRYTEDEAARDALKRDGKVRFQRMLELVEARLSPDPYLLGERYTLCDASALLFYVWGRYFELPVSTLPKYSALAERVLSRTAVQRAFEQEGLGRLLQKKNPGQ